MNLTTFDYLKENQIRTLQKGDGVWFVANDVCSVLGIKNVPDAIGRLDDDEKLLSVLPIAGQNRKVNLVNESGLYALVFKSRKESANKFRKWVTKEVLPTIRKTGQYNSNVNQLPKFTQRYIANKQRINRNYFSVITELFGILHAEFEKVGFLIPDAAENGKGINPDISVGRLFADYLNDINSPFNTQFKKYEHLYPDGRKVEARMYPNLALGLFRDFVISKWIPERANEYFKYRAPLALDYLPKLLTA